MILITADLHAHPFKKFSTNYNGWNSRLVAITDVLDSLLRKALKRKFSAVFILGDLMHEKNRVDSSTVKKLRSVLDLYAAQIHIYCVMGNHDFSDTVGDDIVSTYDYLSEDLIVITKPKKVVIENTNFIMIPFSPYGYSNDIIRDMVKKSSETDRGKRNVVMGHFDIAGAKAGVLDQPIGKELDPEVFTDVYAVFSGHYHKHQVLGKKENINYVGSPIQHTKGEEGEEKVYYQFNELEGAYGYLPVKDTPYFKTYDVFNAKDIKNMIAEAKSENIYATAKIMCDIPQEIIDLITANGIDVEYDDVDVVAKTRLDLNDTETVSASEIIDKYVDYVNPGDNKKLKEIGSQYVQ